MKVYRLKGNKNCSICENQAEFYCDTLDFCLCKKCAVELYRALGEHIVPRAIPNIILRSDAIRQKGERYVGEHFQKSEKDVAFTPETTKKNDDENVVNIAVENKARSFVKKLANRHKMHNIAVKYGQNVPKYKEK